MTIELRRPNVDDPRVRLNRRNPVSPAETHALKQLAAEARHDEAHDVRVVDKAALLEFGESVSKFDELLERELVVRGWFVKAPGKVTNRWRGVGVLEIVAALVAALAGDKLPSGGFMLLALGVGAAGVFTLVIAGAMPARTLAGATMKAMLAAYRRTLRAVLAEARSMDEVAGEPRLAWLETPDRAVVWSVALGLQHEAEEVLERSMEDVRAGRASDVYMPVWYMTWGGGSGQGGGDGVAPGVMSSSPIPNLGGMFAALGTIGNTPSSSGSGGGFSGGSSGGGGGGAGGGF